jgi:hypothetical protein
MTSRTFLSDQRSQPAGTVQSYLNMEGNIADDGVMELLEVPVWSSLSLQIDVVK